ncbi:MAG: hypothetical protein DRJ42_11455 [Deltaproteobacteria bacterium]|nr:MAG: hypothetical protein DRJ42_11455 [Deltaproteobacteria bacterium]
MLKKSLPCSVVLLLVVFATGCSVYDPSLVNRGDSSVSPSFQPPARPDVDDEPDMPEMVFALRDVRLDQRGGDWRGIGFDLDHLNTVEPARATTCNPPSGSLPPVDGNEGRDNVFGETLSPTVLNVLPDLQRDARAAQDFGTGVILVIISGYDGTENDPHVDVSLAVSVYGTTLTDYPNVELVDGVPRVDTRAADEPVWEGTDYFWAREDNFSGGDPKLPRIHDDDAYVSGGYLVVNVPALAEFPFPGQEIGILAKLTETILVGKIGNNRMQLQDVTLAGRWGLLDLRETVNALAACPGIDDSGEAVSILNRLLNDIADVRAHPPSAGPAADCNALSIGITLQGTRANIGGLAPGPSLDTICPP